MNKKFLMSEVLVIAVLGMITFGCSSGDTVSEDAEDPAASLMMDDVQEAQTDELPSATEAQDLFGSAAEPTLPAPEMDAPKLEDPAPVDTVAAVGGTVNETPKPPKAKRVPRRELTQSKPVFDNMDSGAMMAQNEMTPPPPPAPVFQEQMTPPPPPPSMEQTMPQAQPFTNPAALEPPKRGFFGSIPRNVLIGGVILLGGVFYVVRRRFSAPKF